MESVNEKAGSNNSLTAQLRQHDSLSLASDMNLLKCMQDLSLRITSRTNDICHDLETLEKDTTVACIQVENCIQSLNLISTKQFMEKRVYDEEVAELKGENLPVPPPSTAVDFVPKIKEALLHGLPIVRDPNFGQQTSSHNAYTSRFLPHILGSEVFIDSPYVGVAKRKLESKKQKIQATQEFSTVKVFQEASRSVTPPSPTLAKSNNQPLDEDMSSESEVSSVSSKVFPPVMPRESIIEDKPHQPSLNFKDELAARLKIPSAISQTMPSAEQSKVEPQVIRVSQPQHHPQPAPRTVIYPPKRKTLFDESSSESDEDLFKPVPPKIQTPTPTVLRQSTPSPKTVISAQNAPSLPPLKKVNGSAPAVKGVLFGSSDSEDDLFAGVTSSASNSAIKRKPTPIQLDDDEDEDIFSTKTVIPASSQVNTFTKSAPQVTSKSLFSDDENEDDFFPKAKPTPRIIEPVITASNGEKVPSLSLFGDKEDQEKQSIKPTLETAPKPDVAIPQSIISTPKHLIKPSIFTDSESDDEDLFSKIVAKPKSVTITEPSKSQSASPEPEASSNNNPKVFQSTPLKKEIEDSSIATSTNFLRDSNQEKSISIAAPSSHKPIRAQSSLLFTEDSDDEDLFNVVKLKGPSSVKSLEHSQIQDEKKPQVKTVQSIVSLPGNMEAHKIDSDDRKKAPISPSINNLATENLSSLPIVETGSSDMTDVTDKVVDNFTEKIQFPVEDPAISTRETSASSSLIASLKLSLSKQPNSLPFLTTPSPVDADGSSMGSRKPFGGVSIFGSTIPTATSPVPAAEQEIITIQNQVQSENPVGDSLKNKEDNNDSLPCLGRLRPKAPTSRKPPSRNFRRSAVCNEGDNFDAVDAASSVSSDNVTKETNKLLNDELRVSSLEVTETNEKLNPTTSNNQSELTKTSAVSNKLFGESDSSDDELFKPLPAIKRFEAPASREPVSESSLPRKPGGLISNAKINSSLLSSSGGGLGSDSDDGLFSTAQAITPISRVKQNLATSLLADSDDDDDLFASATKHRPKAAAATSSVGGTENKAPPPTDPLLRFLE